MAEAQWDALDGEELRYLDHTWELTGNVDVREGGDVLAVEATQTDDVRHATATLYFEREDPSGSLNPGDLGDRFEDLERTDGDRYVVVRKERQTYRYRLERMEYE